eukprot:jgi/Psemu1/257765/estExt_Genewise1Plus.C_2440035
MTRAALLPLVALSLSVASAADFTGVPRCGDCWCITEGEDATCPTDTTGIVDSFSEVDQIFSTFEATNEPVFLKLQDSAGGDCFPFKDSLGVVPNLPQSNLPQCIRPDETDTAVCAYVYDTSSTTCDGRKYSVQNFASANDAMASNAHIVHKGACGVCSSAQDFGARIKTYGSLDTESIKCAVSYTFTGDFSTLVSCYSNLGFTLGCATLWAHFAATNGRKCATPCVGVTEFNLDPPTCLPGNCLACQTDFRQDFDDIAGIEFPKAGITEAIAQPCSSFTRVIHDPCIGLDTPAALPDGDADTDTDAEADVDTGSVDEPEPVDETEPTEEASASKMMGEANLLALAASLALALSFVAV